MNIEMEQLAISDLVIDVVRKKIKNIHLSVYPPTGRVRIAVPVEVNEETIRLFAISKISWIRKHQRKFEKQERQTARVLETRESHYVDGKRFLLRVTEVDRAPKVQITTKRYLDLFVRPGTVAAQRQVILDRWLRGRLKARLPVLIEKWEAIVGVRVSAWGVKQMKTKWGTCQIESKRIWLNLELAKKTPACLEYVVVHEMVHLLERQHNEVFLAYMNQYLPEWKQLRSELNSLPLSFME